MKANVQFVYKKARYNLITMNGENYILDKDSPKWIIWMPFLFWFISHRAYKVDSEVTVNKLVRHSEKTSGSTINILAIGISLILANLIRPIMDSFNIDMSTFLATLIVLVVTVLMFLLRIYIGRNNQQKLYAQVSSELRNVKELHIKVKSIGYFLIYTGCYLFILAFLIACAMMYVIYGNTIILVVYTMLAFIFFMGNLFTVTPGQMEVRVKD
ncbi:DUF443 domain-containing protein [Oceanobacillus iheyensis]|uniref:DUF443 domain-containing protein n=1 Tax=Oceanobacillus iheyensis TaxID=182710 RepID=UPI003634A509